MSIGLGIFLSTLLLVAAWQIDKRRAWRMVIKVVAWILGGSIAIGGAIAVYFAASGHRKDQKKRDAARAEATRVREGRVNSYWGIELGMSPEQVLYLKGKPNEQSEKHGNSPVQWRYFDTNSPDDYSYSVIFGDDTKVEAVACSAEKIYLNGCETVADVGVKSSEAHLVGVLGQPTSEPTMDDKGYKIMDYGDGRSVFRFILGKQRVDIIIFSAGKMTAERN